MRRLTLLVVVVLAIPSAAACTFIEEPPKPRSSPPKPGSFFLWNPTSGTTTQVPVDGTILGADCGLANLFTFDGTQFAWTEAGSVLLLPDLTGAPPKQYQLSHSDMEDLSFTRTHIYYTTVSVSGTGPGQVYQVTESLYRFSRTTGEEERIELPDAGDKEGRPGLRDGWAFWTQKEPDGTRRVFVYHLPSESWVVRGAPPSALGAPNDNAGLLDFGGGWALLAWRFVDHDGLERTAYWASEMATARALNVTPSEPTDLDEITIDGDRLYWKGFDGSLQIRGARLPGGAPLDLGKPPHPTPSGRLIVREGIVVLAEYSAPDEGDLGGFASLPNVTFLALGAALAMGASGRRVRLRRGRI